jgi:hypothetical protein
MTKTTVTVKASNKLVLINDADALKKEAGLIVASGKRMDKRVQVYLCSEIAHIEEHRNPTRLNKFFAEMKGNGMRVNAMHAFIQTFANVKYDEESKKYNVCRAREDGPEQLEGALRKSWTEFKPEPKVVDFSLEKQVHRIIKKALAIQETPREGVNDVIPANMLKKLIVATGYEVTS